MVSRMDGFNSVGSTGGRDYDGKELFWGEEFDPSPPKLPGWNSSARHRCLSRPGAGRVGPAACRFPTPESRQQTHHRPGPGSRRHPPGYWPHHQGHPLGAHHWPHHHRLYLPRFNSGGLRHGPIPSLPLRRFRRRRLPPRRPGRGRITHAFHYRTSGAFPMAAIWARS